MVDIQILDLPQDVYDALANEATANGQSLQDFVKQVLIERAEQIDTLRARRNST